MFGVGFRFGLFPFFSQPLIECIRVFVYWCIFACLVCVADACVCQCLVCVCACVCVYACMRVCVCVCLVRCGSPDARLTTTVFVSPALSFLWLSLPHRRRLGSCLVYFSFLTAHTPSHPSDRAHASSATHPTQVYVVVLHIFVFLFVFFPLADFQTRSIHPLPSRVIECSPYHALLEWKGQHMRQNQRACIA
jgi:hypothetical protein